MISQTLFPNLEPFNSESAADADGQPEAPTGYMSRVNSGCHQPPAPGVRSGRNLPERDCIIAYAQKILAKKIIAAMPDVPCAPRFQKYLEKQSLSDLVARFNQLQSDEQRELGEPWEIIRERIATRLQILANRKADRRARRKDRS